MNFNRYWCMPNHNTFEMKPVKEIFKRWIKSDLVIIDPFARKSKIGTIRNDLNPNFDTDYHLEAVEFCELIKEKNIVGDIVLYDPPYSPRQISEMYQSIGKKATMEDTQSSFYSKIKRAICEIVKSEGLVISFGWNTNGIGKTLGFEILEINLIAHGGNHNDTLVTIERKRKVYE